MIDLLTQRLILYKEFNPNELSPVQMRDLEREVKQTRGGIDTDEYLDFMLWCRGLPSRQQTFANFIGKKLSKHPGSKVLEVGAGRTAIMSRILSEKGFKMTCIDPKIEINSGKGIEVIKGKFDYRKFDLSPYDFVVAQEPCDATEHIVRACLEQKKPFMISLCGVPHRLISGKMPKNRDEWYNNLRDIGKGELKLRYLSLDPISKTLILKTNEF